MVYDKHYIVVSLGDSEVLGIKKGKAVPIFQNEEDPAGNVTYSMCQEDAYKHIRVKIISLKEYDGILLCSDGLIGPYQDYDNFNESFVKLTLLSLKLGKYKEIEDVVKMIASKVGSGDDVSLALLVKN